LSLSDDRAAELALREAVMAIMARFEEILAPEMIVTIVLRHESSPLAHSLFTTDPEPVKAAELILEHAERLVSQRPDKRLDS